LPLLVRGIYYEGWDPGSKIDGRRNPDSFISRVAAAQQMDHRHAVHATHAVGRVLQRHIAGGEWDDVVASLAKPVRELLD
jgi:uncharacterized protein (DUF2267 family)